ncbi:hypothetical protein [Chromobacterium subtsugae]|uniref:hypothetical protein n=1 Tax=Chromobacterium subtsugae TaxID=251747 RepID=UPI0006412AFB|nr:hypothetical protein [Chromobacterium subtsugae]
MNSPKLAIDVLVNITNEATKACTLTEKAALYSAARHLLADLEVYVNEYRKGDGYILEKLTSARWHIGAVLGFDINPSRDCSAHYIWALNDLESVTNRLPDEH